MSSYITEYIRLKSLRAVLGRGRSVEFGRQQIVLDTMNVWFNGGNGGRGRVKSRKCPLLPGQGPMTLAWYREWYGVENVIKNAKKFIALAQPLMIEWE